MDILLELFVQLLQTLGLARRTLGHLLALTGLFGRFLGS
jgi:hypothetical protein